MATCFVIQPFDSGKYDKRYDDVFSNAIVAAGLDPYRVDRDSLADVPIESIEDGIRRATVVFADITENNPNVWYELGVAVACGKPLVMVCSKERVKYPFDIQHRAVISYSTDSPSDFTTLRAAITERLAGLLKRSENVRQVAEADPIAPVAGLSQPELYVLSILAGSITTGGEARASLWSLKQDVEKAGLTPVGFALGLRRLTSKGMVMNTQDEDERGETYDALMMTDKGWDWVERNEEKFRLRKEPKGGPGSGEFDDDIPF